MPSGPRNQGTGKGKKKKPVAKKVKKCEKQRSCTKEAASKTCHKSLSRNHPSFP